MASPDDSTESETSFKFQLKTAVTTLGREKKPSLVRVLLGLPRAKKAFQTIRGRFAVRRSFVLTTLPHLSLPQALDVDGDGVISHIVLTISPFASISPRRSMSTATA